MTLLAAAEREPALDSLRGIAAVTVVLNHFLVAIPAMSWLVGYGALGLLIARSPLRSLWSGYEAVMFFFVLSGFVLAPAFLRESRWYPAFVVKRLFRLYPAYLVAVVTALGAAALLAGTLIGPAPWPWVTWTTPVTAALVGGHLAMVLPFKSWAFDPVLWSLVQEMRISLLFPLLVLAVLRYGWLRSLILALVVAIVATVMQARGASTDLSQTPEFLVVFVIGILTARHRQALVAWFRSLGAPGQLLLGAAAWFAYSYRYWFLPARPEFHPQLLTDLLPAMAAATAIVAVLALPSLGAALLAPPLRLLGRISYSLYLLHAVALLSALYLVAAHGLPLWVAWPAAATTALVAAWLCQRFVELPFTTLGASAAEKLSRLRVRRPAGDPKPAIAAVAVPGPG